MSGLRGRELSCPREETRYLTQFQFLFVFVSRVIINIL